MSGDVRVISMVDKQGNKKKALTVDVEKYIEVRLWVPSGQAIQMTSVKSPVGGTEYVVKMK